MLPLERTLGLFVLLNSSIGLLIFFPFGTNLHVVGIAAFCWAIWKTRNRACFEKRFISSPVELICYMCAFLCYWAGLQSGDAREVLTEGASRIQAVAMQEQMKADDAKGLRIQELKDDKGDDQ